jgi:hypothetical protein
MCSPNRGGEDRTDLMPHTSSAITSATRLRQRYTGEPHRIARQAITELDDPNRLVPAAVSVAQRRLETALLVKVRDAAPSLSTPYHGHQVFQMVSPMPYGLTIELVDDAVVRYIRALLPSHEPDDRWYGVPGIRFVPEKNHLRVHLLSRAGDLTDACVILRNITARQWPDIWAKVTDFDYPEEEYGYIDPVRAQSLSLGEQACQEKYWQYIGPIGLGSAMLRRCGLFMPAYALDVWTGDGGTVLSVEIEEGPSVYEVVAALRHPTAGLIDGQFAVDIRNGPVEWDTTYERIIDTAPTPATYIGQQRLLNGSRPALVLRGFPRPERRTSHHPTPETITREDQRDRRAHGDHG